MSWLQIPPPGRRVHRTRARHHQPELRGKINIGPQADYLAPVQYLFPYLLGCGAGQTTCGSCFVQGQPLGQNPGGCT